MDCSARFGPVARVEGTCGGTAPGAGRAATGAGGSSSRRSRSGGGGGSAMLAPLCVRECVVFGLGVACMSWLLCFLYEIFLFFF